MNKPNTPDSLNQQIRQLQLQMAAEHVIQQTQRMKVQELLLERLTSWPVLLGAVATGLLLSQTREQNGHIAAASARPEHDAATTTCSAERTTAQTVAPEPASSSLWSRLLSVPLLTQGIWWLAEQIWYSRLFRDVIRQKLLKSPQRHPPY
jgi:hypothetical protein